MNTIKSITKYSLKYLLCSIMILSLVVTFIPQAPKADALYENWQIVIQNQAKWDNYVYGTGTLRATGCGIFSLVNAVGYLTGNAMDVPTVAQWAYNIGGYNKGGADGTYRYELYPYVTAKYGEQFGFTIDTNGTQGWWANVKSSVLINHLNSGGTAIAHVPGHFIAIVDYNASNNTYHVLDSYPTTARGSYPGDVWLSASHLTTVAKMTVDWFCLVSEAQTNKVKAPTVTVNSVVAHNAALPVSWAAVENATSYTYKAEVYKGEISATTATTVASGTVSGTSVTIPAQAAGKYMKVTVTAVGPENTATTTKSVMMGPWVGSYPTDVEYIPVADVNGSVSASNSTVWTSSKGTSFGMTWWRAFVCSPNADGTYTVNSIYENGATKSVSVSGNQILFAIHSGYTNYQYCSKIVTGDKLTLVGIYLDNATIRGNGYILVNGGVPIGPSSLTIKDTSVKYSGNYLTGANVGITGTQLAQKFNEDASYIVVKDAAGSVVTSGAVCTGYTVNLVVNNVVKQSYTLAVDGDVNCDGIISVSDLLSISKVIDGTGTLGELYTCAGDMDGSGNIATTDYMIMCTAIET